MIKSYIKMCFMTETEFQSYVFTGKPSQRILSYGRCLRSTIICRWTLFVSIFDAELQRILRS